MKKIIFLILSVFFLPMMAYAESSLQNQYNTPHFRIGVWSGSSFEELAKKKFPKATLVYFKDSTDDLVEALRHSKIDGFISDHVAAMNLLEQNPDLSLSKTSIGKTQYAMAFRPDNLALRNEFATELKKMKTSGELQRLQQDWFSADDSLKKMSTAPYGTRGTLHVGTCAVDPPFSYYSNNKLVGIEIELVNRIASRLNYTVEWSLVDHSSFIPDLKNKKIDIEAALITITPKRAAQILFGEPDYEDSVVFITRKE